MNDLYFLFYFCFCKSFSTLGKVINSILVTGYVNTIKYIYTNALL